MLAIWGTLRRMLTKPVRIPDWILVYAAVQLVFLSCYTLQLSRNSHYWYLESLWLTSSVGAYGDLADAFNHGHVDLLIEPDPTLLNAKPEEIYKADRSDSIHVEKEYSYFHRRYYLYFGPGVALLFYCPVSLLTGAMPSQKVVYLVLCSLNLLVSSVLLRQLCRLIHPGASLTLQAAILILFGATNLLGCFQEWPRIYEQAIVAGTLFVLCTLSCVLAAWRSERHRLMWLLLAGICEAAAISCRLTEVPLMAALAGVWLVELKRCRFSWAEGGISGVALMAPGVLCLLSLMAYNEARFHDPWESGFHYQLTLRNNLSEPHLLGLHFVPDSIWSYYVQPYTFLREYPYMKWPFTVPDYLHVIRERHGTVGLLTAFPILIIGLFWPVWIQCLRDPASRIICWNWVVLVSVWNGLIALTLCCFMAVCLRYEIELQAPLLLQLTVALLCRCRSSRPLHIVERLGFVTLLLLSISLGIYTNLFGSELDHPYIFGVVDC